MSVVQVFSLATGILIVSEAILLLVGITILGPRPNKWNTMRNSNTLFIDIAFGALLILNAIEINQFIQVSVIALLATHAFREAEYFNLKNESRFLFNVPLFAINTVKLVSLVILLFLVI
jgi:hypothetical protein